MWANQTWSTSAPPQVMAGGCGGVEGGGGREGEVEEREEKGWIDKPYRAMALSRLH